mgnify:FL=1
MSRPCYAQSACDCLRWCSILLLCCSTEAAPRRFVVVERHSALSQLTLFAQMAAAPRPSNSHRVGAKAVHISSIEEVKARLIDRHRRISTLRLARQLRELRQDAKGGDSDVDVGAVPPSLDECLGDCGGPCGDGDIPPAGDGASEWLSRDALEALDEELRQEEEVRMEAAWRVAYSDWASHCAAEADYAEALWAHHQSQQQRCVDVADSHDAVADVPCVSD